MKMLNSLLTTGLALFLLSASTMAGEVKGPPGQIDNTDYTGAPENANSNCAYSGLNDFDTSDPIGQLTSIVQVAADAFKYYLLDPGVQGTWGLCKGGTNQARG